MSRANPLADTNAETFLRTAEPPSHNQWTATPDLKAVYARGCKAKLEAFLKAAAEAVRELVKPTPNDTGDGPNPLKELFRIGSEPSSRPEQPRVIWQEGKLDASGRWGVRARVRVKARKWRQKLTPAVYFLAETGTGTPVSWESLKGERGCEANGLSLIIPPDTRELSFSGLTDPSTHPIPASDSCVEVNIKKLVDLKGTEI
jgi:RNA polymerase primary sigma factor